MAVTVENYGSLADGTKVERYVLSAGSLTATILTYGATLQALTFEGTDVVLGYDDLDGYINGTSNQGATIGRYANRIAKGLFTLNGKQYDVGCNEKGIGHLHGGFKGFNSYVWKAEVVSQGEEPSVRFTHFSPDGDEGYPGNLTVSVTYTIVGGNTLDLTYNAVCDKDTVANFTNHSYFNLNGGKGTVLDTQLQIFAQYYNPVDKAFIPTGELRSVSDTAFDFNKPKKIGTDINNEDEQLKITGGYDHNYVLGNDRSFRLAAEAFCEESGIRMQCSTDLPGVQLYTSNMLSEPVGKQGKPLINNHGFCLETQFFPDSPNHENFPSAVLKKGETFVTVTTYKFTK